MIHFSRKGKINEEHTGVSGVHSNNFKIDHVRNEDKNIFIFIINYLLFHVYMVCYRLLATLDRYVYYISCSIYRSFTDYINSFRSSYSCQGYWTKNNNYGGVNNIYNIILSVQI